MKAIVINPRLGQGRIVDVVPNDDDCIADYKTTDKYPAYFSADDISIQDNDALVHLPTDWAAFRREAAKDILVGFAAKIGHPMSDYPEQSCKYAIQLADELIKQLKENKK